MNTLAIKLKIKAEKIVKKGHPWVFSQSISKQNTKGVAGDIAILFGQHDNEVYAIGLYDPHSPVRIKIIHRGKGVQIDAQFFQQKIARAFQIRVPLLQKDTNAYRLLFGENDGFPGMIVDIYNQVGVLKLYSEIWLPYLPMITPALVHAAGIESLVLRLSRNLQKQPITYQEGSVLYGNLKDPEVLFTEHGVHFKTHVILGHKTGFFLDHRDNRHRIGSLSKGKTVLDVFSYAGGFSIHALAGGAKEVTCIDFSMQALALAKTNARLNPHSGIFNTLSGDAFTLLKELHKKGKTYDIVIIDPPSLAKSKSEKDIAKRKYAELARLGVALTKRKGILLLASCSSRITTTAFLEIHQREFAQLGVEYQTLAFTEHDLDHPVTFKEGAYLKSVFYKID